MGRYIDVPAGAFGRGWATLTFGPGSANPRPRPLEHLVRGKVIGFFADRPKTSEKFDVVFELDNDTVRRGEDVILDYLVGDARVRQPPPQPPYSTSKQLIGTRIEYAFNLTDGTVRWYGGKVLGSSRGGWFTVAFDDGTTQKVKMESAQERKCWRMEATSHAPSASDMGAVGATPDMAVSPPFSPPPPAKSAFSTENDKRKGRWKSKSKRQVLEPSQRVHKAEEQQQQSESKKRAASASAASTADHAKLDNLVSAVSSSHNSRLSSGGGMTNKDILTGGDADKATVAVKCNKGNSRRCSAGQRVECKFDVSSLDGGVAKSSSSLLAWVAGTVRQGCKVQNWWTVDFDDGDTMVMLLLPSAQGDVWRPIDFPPPSAAAAKKKRKQSSATLDANKAATVQEVPWVLSKKQRNMFRYDWVRARADDDCDDHYDPDKQPDTNTVHLKSGILKIAANGTSRGINTSAAKPSWGRTDYDLGFACAECRRLCGMEMFLQKNGKKLRLQIVTQLFCQCCDGSGQLSDNGESQLVNVFKAYYKPMHAMW